MTTTAHEDQYTAAPEPVRQPYDTVAILRRNIAEAEKEMQRQAERAESYAETLRSLASYVGAGGYNSDTVDAGVFEEKIRWGIGEIMTRAEAAEAELVKAREQKPIKYLYRVTDCFGHDVLRDDPKGATILETIPLFAAPVPAPAVPTNTIPEGDDFNGTTPHMIRCIESLVSMNDRGALSPHGLCGHSRTLLLASANRLRQQQAHVVPAVPDEWRDDVFAAAEELRSTVRDLKNGFVRCGNCGEQETTSDLDCVSDIDGALELLDGLLQSAPPLSP